MGQGFSSSFSSNPKHIICNGNSNSISSKWNNADHTLCLPDECLAIVFGKLSCQDRNNCSLVCKRWKVVESKTRQRLVLVARFEMLPYLSTLLARFNSVSVLSLKCSRKHVSIDDNALSQLPALLTCLKKLKLKGCIDLTDNGLHAFSLHRPSLLTKLSLASCGFGSTGLISILINCPSLQHLTLKRLRKLDAQDTPLSFHVYYSIMDSSVTLTDHKWNCKLERLCLKDLHNARLFTPLLCSCDNTLKTLIVCRSSGSWDTVLNTFQGRITTISEIQMENVQMGDEGLLAISNSCPDLETLYLSRPSDCTDYGLSAIANSCKKLRKLHIDAWSRFGSRTIGDEGVLSIASRCFQLQEIVLMGVPVTVTSLVALASNCPTLDRMALCNTDTVGDIEMALIGAKFCALKKLCIKNCPISNSGVEAIVGGCPSLVKLKVKRCRRVTFKQTSVYKLRMQRSSLVVSLDAVSMLFEAEDDEATANSGRRNATSNSNSNIILPSTTNTTNNNARTHVICSSRGAQLLMSKFGWRRVANEEISHSRRSSFATCHPLR